jgi:hypothetical protein
VALADTAPSGVASFRALRYRSTAATASAWRISGESAGGHRFDEALVADSVDIRERDAAAAEGLERGRGYR